MFTGSIKISELDILATVAAVDFFPLVQSGSVTTFKVNVATLNNWWAISGSALSASWASASLISTQTISASWASQSLNSKFSISASWASSSISASYAFSASSALRGVSASYAFASTSASYAPFTQIIQPSASWASASLSSSYALSASYAPALADTLPIGTVIGFGGSTAPNNYLECNGDAKSTASFSELYTAIQTTDPSSSFGYLCDSFGNRNASGGFFKIPDFRGEFIRGWDHNRGVDLNRVNTSFQASSVQAHKHIEGWGESSAGPFGNTAEKGHHGSGDSDNDNFYYYTNDGTPFGSNNPNAVGVITTETRPRNIAIMYCIKYSNVTNFATSGVTLAGDVVGNSSATNVVAIQGVPVTSSAPSDGQVLEYDASSGKWVPRSAIATGLIAAWATILIPTASNYSSDNPTVVANGNSVNKPRILNSFNVADVSWTAATINPSSPWSFGRGPDGGQTGGCNFLITLSSAAGNYNYAVMGTWMSKNNGGAGDTSDLGTITFNPLAARTTTKLTASMNGGEFSGNPQSSWFSIIIMA